MNRLRRKATFFIGVASVAIFCAVSAVAQTAPKNQVRITLEELEQMALQQNPTLAQAAARVRATTGRKIQVGLYPNPAVGYTGDEVSRGPVIRGGEHGFFVDQNIVTAGKLRLSRNVFAREELLAEAEAQAQRYRVLNAVRRLYYQALGAERLVELHGRLVRLAQEAVETSRQLFNVGQADQPDLLAAEVEEQRAELGLVAARNDRQRIWRQLAAAVGNPSLPLTPLAGALEDAAPQLDEESLLAGLLRESPEVKIAEAAIDRQKAALQRARVEWIPDINVRGGLRYNRELLERGGTPVGLEGFADVGVRIPLFDRNQGNVAALRAELEIAQREVERVRLALHARLAAAFRNYQDAAEMVERYRKNVLPRAQQAYELYLKKFRQMAAAYPQVLIAQRTHFQLQVDYVTALVNQWQRVVEIRGFLLFDQPGESPPAGDWRGRVGKDE